MMIFNPLAKIEKGDIKKETAAKILHLLDGLSYRDVKIIFEMVNGALGYYLSVNSLNFEKDENKLPQ